uniref:Uncharacterized protein n=1 Tax=Anguilla anguilla TaxID=7936 RepID=A0A0E9TMR6_ANGAN
MIGFITTPIVTPYTQASSQSVNMFITGPLAQ